MTKNNATYGVSVKKRVIFAPAFATRQSTVAAEDVQNFNPFSSVKDLLATGFLEGAPVKYVFKKHQVELHGFIVRDGYQCGCSSCNYTRVLSANEFEKHSGVTSSFANDHILLENGISLNEVVKHMVNTPLDSLHEKLEELTGCEIDSEDYDAWRKGLFLARSPRHDRKQIKAARELNQESPSDLISQLKLELSFQQKRTRSARGNPCARPPPPTVERSPEKNLRPASVDLSSVPGSSLHGVELRKPIIVDTPRPQEKEEQRAEASPAKYAKGLDVKRFLSTGLLEGSPVTYTFKKANVALSGFIKGCGYLCGCSSCHYSKVISALEFEKHAGASTSNQNHHILLPSGISLYNLIKELKTVPLDSWSQVLEKRIGRKANLKCFDLWKESHQITSEEIEETSMDTEDHQEQIQQDPRYVSGLQDQTAEGMASDISTFPPSEGSIDVPCSKLSDSSLLNQIRVVADGPLEENKRSSLSPDKPYLPENPVYPQKQNSGAQGSLKKRDHYLHDLLFEESGLPDTTVLNYVTNGEIKLTGVKYGKGILCGCCEEEISPSKFEDHAGFGSRRQPYHNILLGSGISLHQLSVWLSQGDELVINDDWCRICGDEGDLQGCFGCSAAYHSRCLGAPIPRGKLYCPFCDGSRPASISSTCVRRRLDPPHNEFGGCILCKDKYYFYSTTAEVHEKTMFLCRQCEKEYHVGCLKHHGICDLKTKNRFWICSEDCKRLRAEVRNYVLTGPKRVPMSLLSTMERKVGERRFINKSEAHMQWQVLSGLRQPLEYKLLMEAIEVLREGFAYIVEKLRDLIPAMVYSRDVGRQFYHGMYTVVLIVESVVVSVGMLRIFGKDVAELPLVATRKKSRGKGYLGILLSLIEGLLSELNVELLILPEAENAHQMWINKFGFVKMTKERFEKYANMAPILMYQGTTFLEKEVPRISSPIQERS